MNLAVVPKNNYEKISDICIDPFFPISVVCSQIQFPYTKLRKGKQVKTKLMQNIIKAYFMVQKTNYPRSLPKE